MNVFAVNLGYKNKVQYFLNISGSLRATKTKPSRSISSHSLSKAHHVVADIEGGVELPHEDLTQDPGARCEPCPAPGRRLRREERECD